MSVPVPRGPDVSSGAVWPATARRSMVQRSGWLLAMVTAAQEQRRHGHVPPELPVPCHRRPLVPASPLPGAEPTPPSVPPTLQHIAREDLTDIQRVLVLYDQAVQQRLIGA